MKELKGKVAVDYWCGERHRAAGRRAPLDVTKLHTNNF
jgi:hypothetical protein